VALDDVLLLEWPREARPPGARVELVERAEERLARDDVDVDAGLLVVPEGVPERRLGRLVLRDLVLLGGQPLLEVGVAPLAGVRHRPLPAAPRPVGGAEDGQGKQDQAADAPGNEDESHGWLDAPRQLRFPRRRGVSTVTRSRDRRPGLAGLRLPCSAGRKSLD